MLSIILESNSLAAHLTKNLRDYVDEFFTRKQVWLSKLAEAETEKSTSASPAPTQLAESQLPPLAASSLKLGLAEAKTERPPTKTNEAQLKAQRYQNRLERYEQVRELAEGGLSNREIARQLELDRNTINRYTQASGAEEAVGSKSRPGQFTLIDPYGAGLHWFEWSNPGLFSPLATKGLLECNAD